MNRSHFIVVACALALMVGCAKNKSNKQTAANFKAEPFNATTQPSGEITETSETNETNATNVSANPTASPTTEPSASGANPLEGSWQLAIPRRHQKDASITATDSTHVTIQAGKGLSGDYVVQGNYLLILSRDERMRPLAWKINSDDSLTLVRGPDLGTGRNYTGITLLRAPDSSATEADMEELVP